MRVVDVDVALGDIYSIKPPVVVKSFLEAWERFIIPHKFFPIIAKSQLFNIKL